MNKALSSLATKYTLARCIRIRAREAQFCVEDDILPALLVYRGGLFVSSWMQATAEVMNTVHQEFGVESLEQFLLAQDVLHPHDIL